MFEIPNAKRIRRADLNDADGDTTAEPGSLSGDNDFRGESPDAAVSAALQARLAALYGDVVEEEAPFSIDPATGPTLASQAGHSRTSSNAETDGDTTYTFRLFNTSSSSSLPVPSSKPSEGEPESSSRQPAAIQQKITISSTTAPKGQDSNAGVGGGGGFLSARPLSHYHTSAAKSQAVAHRQRMRFSDPQVAVSGSWIRAQAEQRNRGLEMPWRVRTVRVSRKVFAALDAVMAGGKVELEGGDSGNGDGSGDVEGVRGESVRGKKGRPNKKRRIILRERQRKKVARKLEKEKAKMLIEQEYRDKKTRRNREKKVKKRVRDKVKKAEAKAVSGGADVEVDVDTAGVGSHSDAMQIGIE